MPSAVVTGAARGLGRAVASTLSVRGYTVHVTDVEETEAVEAAGAIGGQAFGSALDVRDEEACHSVAAATVQMTGSLDLWVNNAGVLITGDAWEQDAAARRLMIDVNLIGTMNGTVAALEPMMAAGRGHVINVISLTGLVAAPGEVAYAASKHGAIAFTLGTLLDLRRAGIRGIHLSALCPDGIWTPMLKNKVDDPAAAVSFSGVLLTPEQVAAELGRLVDRPRPVASFPRWRGALVRTLDTFPALGAIGVGWFMRDAARRQRRYRRLIESGQWPPP
ncbi:MAG: SDR family NAD(P)-dependent oxidoreductase [Solirubrobacterales bacterium]